MGEVCSHLSEGERRVIQIEIGNGAGIRGIGLMPGRNASTAGGEAKRNTWVPVRRERVLPAVPAETAEDGPVDGRMLHRRPRAAQGRPQARQAAQAPPPVMRTPVGAGGRMAGSRLVAAGGRPRVPFPDDPAMRVCPETVHRWVYADRHRRERRARRLPRGSRRRRGRGGGRTSRFPIPGRVPISGHPPGHSPTNC